MNIPVEVLRAATGRPDARTGDHTAEPVKASNGVVTGGVWRVRGTASTGGGPVPFRLVVKELTAAPFERHHWAYWRREALAYTSGLLPAGPGGLVAPRCLGVEDDGERIRLYLTEVADTPPSLRRAARQLGVWQAGHLVRGLPVQDWFAGHQLAQRIADTDAAGGLDWHGVPLEPSLRRRAIDGWAERNRLLAGLAAVPATLCHGDFHAWNLFAGSDGQTVVIDWSNLGLGPVGSDLAYLVLSDPDGSHDELRGPYLDGLAAAGWRGDGRLALLGYCATAGLTGLSRTHWTLVRRPDAAVAAATAWSLDRIDEALSIAAEM